MQAEVGGVEIARALARVRDGRGELYRLAGLRTETVDARGKGAQMLGIPAEGLWKMFPGADAATLQDWKTLVDAAPPVEVTPEGNAMNLSRNLAGMASASARRVPGSARGTAAPQRRTVA